MSTIHEEVAEVMEDVKSEFNSTKDLVHDLKKEVHDFRDRTAEQARILEAKGKDDVILFDEIKKRELELCKKLEQVEKRQLQLSSAQKDESNIEKAIEAFNRATRSNQINYNLSKEQYSNYMRGMNGGALKAALKARGMNQLTIEQQKDLQVGIDSQGGFTVVPEMSNQIIRKRFETSPMRDIATVEQINSSLLELIVDFDEFDADFVKELQTFGVTDNARFYKKRIEVHTIAAKPVVSMELLDDSVINLTDFISEKVNKRFKRKENAAFINGDGVGKPRGILTLDNGSLYGQVEQVASGNVGAVSWSDILELMGALKSDYHDNATFLMTRQTFITKLLTIVGGDGQYLVNVLEKDGVPTSVAGVPVRFFQDMPAVATGALPIAFGDFREGYTIAARKGFTLLLDPYSVDNAVMFKAHERVGGDVTNSEAFKLLRIA